MREHVSGPLFTASIAVHEEGKPTSAPLSIVTPEAAPYGVRASVAWKNRERGYAFVELATPGADIIREDYDLDFEIRDRSGVAIFKNTRGLKYRGSDRVIACRLRIDADAAGPLMLHVSIRGWSERILVVRADAPAQDKS